MSEQPSIPTKDEHLRALGLSLRHHPAKTAKTAMLLKTIKKRKGNVMLRVSLKKQRWFSGCLLLFGSVWKYGLASLFLLGPMFLKFLLAPQFSFPDILTCSEGTYPWDQSFKALPFGFDFWEALHHANFINESAFKLPQANIQMNLQ